MTAQTVAEILAEYHLKVQAAQEEFDRKLEPIAEAMDAAILAAKDECDRKLAELGVSS